MLVETIIPEFKTYIIYLLFTCCYTCIILKANSCYNVFTKKRSGCVSVCSLLKDIQCNIVGCILYIVLWWIVVLLPVIPYLLINFIYLLFTCCFTCTCIIKLILGIKSYNEKFLICKCFVGNVNNFCLLILTTNIHCWCNRRPVLPVCYLVSICFYCYCK